MPINSSRRLQDSDSDSSDGAGRSHTARLSSCTSRQLRQQQTTAAPPTTTANANQQSTTDATVRNQSASVPRGISLLTAPELLRIGLEFVGFDADRQANVCLDTNLKRWKAFYGLPPTTLLPVLVDIKAKFPATRRENQNQSF